MAGPDIKAIDALPAPTPGKETPEPDTKSLDALLDSLNGSAERFQTLWFSFLGLTLYIAIAALATTHRNLLLGEAQTLPILNIKVELLPFYVIAPLLYLVFHFYLLMMLALLARTAAEFDKQLRTTPLPDEADRERYRARVENALFLQLLVGMKGERAGFNAFLLGLIALITIVLAPLATLILMQLMFLPYHHLRITWFHRAIVVADLVLIVVMTWRCFFPRGLRKAPLVLGALSPKPRWATGMVLSALLAFGLFHLVDWLSFREGRWAGEPRPSSLAEWRQWMAGEPPPSPKVNPDYAATAKGVVFGLFPDRLRLNDESIVGEAKLEEIKKEIASRGGTDFVPTIRIDGRDLQAAVLNGADLRGMSLDRSLMRGAYLPFSRLDAASLFGAQLQGANLFQAQLQGTDLRGVSLQGANLEGAQLQGANLFRAQLQGANLSAAQLQGANLTEAQLQGADLPAAQLQGADLRDAQLQGASLYGAQLQGASLYGAQLQGADLGSVELRGGDLRVAQLQGANLSGADLADCTLDGTLVFRTNIAAAQLAMAAIGSIDATHVKPADIEAWITAATQFALADEKEDIAIRFSRLKAETTDHDATDASKWKSFQDSYHLSDPDGVQHRQRLATMLGDLACDTYGAPYAARALVGQPDLGDPGRLAALGDQLDSVRKRITAARKNPEKCPGVAGFTEGDWRRLDAIKPSEPAPAGH